MNNNLFKVIVVGNSGVGKSSLVYKFIYKNNLVPQATIGVDYSKYEININNQKYKLVIWDTAGQEKYQCVIKSFYRNIDIVLLFFSLDDKKSFDDLSYWLEEIKKEQLNMDSISIILIGNKNDVERKVTYNEAIDFAKLHNLLYLETCYLSQELVDKCFISAIQFHINNNVLKTPPEPNKKNLEILDEEYVLASCC